MGLSETYRDHSDAAQRCAQQPSHHGHTAAVAAETRVVAALKYNDVAVITGGGGE
eukprot:COSAG05_NODE_178_length_14897_cov_619.335248_6_plen_55_part_00